MISCTQKIAIIVTLVLCLLLPADTRAQQLISRKYTIDNGLSSNRVYSIAQDSIGFMWFGTDNGLNRFDGISFRKYYFSESPGSISSNSIRKIIIDRSQHMWIALDNGVDIYDPRTDTFAHFDAVTSNGEQVTTRVLDIIQDREGFIWIATNGSGLYCYAPETGELVSHRYSPDGTASIPQDIVVTLFQDSHNNIWLGTYNQGLCCYSKSDRTFTTYRENPSPNGLPDNSVQRIFEDSHGNLWIGTFQNGLALYDYSNGTFQTFRDVDNYLYHIQDITEYTPGQLLIASDNGIAIFDIARGKVTPPKESSLRLAGQSNKFIYSLFKDKEESLWLGSYYDGIEFYSGFQNHFEYYSCTTDELSKPGRVINTLCENTDGNFWIGTDDNGIFRFDPRSKQVTPYRRASDINLSYYCIHDLLLDNGKLYAATYERGLEVFDLHTGRLTSFLHNPADSTSISSSRVFDLYKASNGSIYVGTSVGLCIFNREAGNFRRVADIGKIASMIEDAHGKLWIATSENGLYSYEMKNNRLVSYKYQPGDPATLSRNTLTVLALDRKKRLWIGTHGYGLCRYDEQTDSFVRYPLPDFPNHIIASIIPEGDNLWISTNKGLSLYNPDTNELKTYTRSNGLYNEQFIPGAGIKSADGRVLMGTANGFCYFPAQKITENQYDAPVVLTQLSILGNDIHPARNDSPLRQSIEFTDKITLTHKQSFIGFSFASLSYISPEENQYTYKLAGFDPGWRTAKGNQNDIQYTNLPAGDYTLHIRGTNSDNLWSTRDRMLHIKVLPPFYKSRLAYSLYFLFVIASICMLIYYLVRLSAQKQQRRIEQINTEKEKELYDSKIEFFTHIAHEIRTPLSLIVGPLEYMRNSHPIAQQFGEYLAIMEQNYQRLSNLVNQLLDFRKVDSGLYKLNYNTYPFKPLLEEIISLFDLTARQKNIRLQLTVSPENASIVTDKEALTKVISNLVSNAIKYARHEIIIHAQSDSDNGITISVTDDGPGIPDPEKEKIFDAFYQTPSHKEINKLGMGIGLNMTRSIIGLLGGQIIAEDRPDNHPGLTVNILLPNQSETALPASNDAGLDSVFLLEAPEKDLKDSLHVAKETKTYSVLAVDDNADILDFLSKVLGRDYFVISANSGEEALAILESNQVDIIVSDVMMNEMNGFDLCRHIKSNINTSHIPVILLTAKTDTASKIEGLESGADAYMEKPFSPFHLNAQIRNLLHKREETRKKYASNPFAEIHSAVHSKLDEEFMNRCTVIIQTNISEPDFSVDILARELGMSRTSVFVKVKGITGMTPNDFIKLTRLKQACKLMSETNYRITEIGFLVGFSSSSYFARCFQKQFGMLPTEFMKKIGSKEDFSQ